MVYIIELKDTRYVSNRGIDFFLKKCYSYTKCACRCYPYIIIVYKILLMSVARQRSPTQVANGFSMGKGWLLSWMRCGVLSSLSFTDNNGVRYLDQAWLRKGTNIVGGKKGNIT